MNILEGETPTISIIDRLAEGIQLIQGKGCF